MHTKNNQRTGAFGEEVVSAYLMANRAEIIERNWRIRDGEMPLVAGVTKLHQALSEHRQIAISLTKALQGIITGDAQSGTVKNLQKVKATQTLWAMVSNLRDAQAAKAGL